MKTTILSTIALAALVMIGATSQADAHPRGVPAGHVYISGYRSCGTPIYTERYFVRHDRRGYPVWGYRAVPDRPSYRAAYRPAPRYYAPAVVCPPPVRVYAPPVCAPVYPARGTGITITGSFRR